MVRNKSRQKPELDGNRDISQKHSKISSKNQIKLQNSPTHQDIRKYPSIIFCHVDMEHSPSKNNTTTKGSSQQKRALDFLTRKGICKKRGFFLQKKIHRRSLDGRRREMIAAHRHSRARDYARTAYGSREKAASGCYTQISRWSKQ